MSLTLSVGPLGSLPNGAKSNIDIFKIVFYNSVGTREAYFSTFNGDPEST